MRRRAGVMATCAVAFCLTLAGCSNGAPEPAPTTSAPDGGTAECTVDLITAAVRADFEANYPGSTFVSLDAFACEDSWAKADAQFEASGSTFPTVVLLQAQNGAWVAVTIESACQASQQDSGIPATIYDEVCGTN